MNYNDFFTGGAKNNLRIYHLKEELVKMRRVKGKGVPQVDKKSTMHDTEPSKAAKKMAKKIAASRELENGRNINGETIISFTMVENRPIINNNGKKQFKKTEYKYEAKVTLNKTVKKIKQKDGKMKSIQKRYNISVSQKDRNVIKNVGKKTQKKQSKKKVSNNVAKIENVSKTINEMNALLNENVNKSKNKSKSKSKSKSKNNNKNKSKNANVANNGANMANNGANMANNGANMANNGTNMANNSTNMANNGANMANNGTNMANNGTNMANNNLLEGGYYYY